MKTRILGIAVIATLTLSLVATAVGAVTQAVNEQPSNPGEDRFASQVNDNNQQSDESLLHNTFTFVCPFH